MANPEKLNPEKLAFYEKYAHAAMEQQQKYGIPASITLAQMYIESNGGKSRLAENGNNFFGIKCPPGWVDSGKPFSQHNDDRPNEKFCNYASVEESVLHHSQFLMGKRYERCRQCASDDYRGWATGLQAAGYATNRNYAASLVRDIEAYGLAKYDEMAIQTATQPIGYAKNERVEIGTVQPMVTMDMEQPQITEAAYCLPVGDGSGIVVTSLFGHRSAPTAGASTEHKGLDIAAKYEDVYSMEKGTVVDVGSDQKSGNYIKIKYERAEGKSYTVSFCHLDDNSIKVRKGDSVEAGDVIARSGATGVGTGPHLHLTVRKDDGQGNNERIDPLDYLAEITVRGNLTGKVQMKGTNEDLLAGRLSTVDVTPTPHEVLLAQQSGKNLTPAQQKNAAQGINLANLAKSNDPLMMLACLMGANGEGLSSGDNIISELISSLFKGAILMGISLDRSGKTAQQDVVAGHQEKPETAEEKSVTLVRRERESVDPDKARELAMMNFDAEYPEESHTVMRQRQLQ